MLRIICQHPQLSDLLQPLLNVGRANRTAWLHHERENGCGQHQAADEQIVHFESDVMVEEQLPSGILKEWRMLDGGPHLVERWLHLELASGPFPHCSERCVERRLARHGMLSGNSHSRDRKQDAPEGFECGTQCNSGRQPTNLFLTTTSGMLPTVHDHSTTMSKTLPDVHGEHLATSHVSEPKVRPVAPPCFPSRAAFP